MYGPETASGEFKSALMFVCERLYTYHASGYSKISEH